MQVENEVAKTDVGQTFQNGIDRGTLLGHEQDALAAGDERRDEIRDGLAFAGPRRSLDD
ncbi:MAG TPA: hypothetical protein VMB05_16075 [Solirubrobacteraceae bacterium]|nr:hypothetical protein [Solirubrobacteraceae bacterium]